MISEGYVTNGATVYISSRDAKACEKAVSELNALGKGKAHAIPADFYKEEDIQHLVDEFKKRESSECASMLPRVRLVGSDEIILISQSCMSLSIIPDQTGERRMMNIRPRRGQGS
jgi:hypothetical protein